MGNASRSPASPPAMRKQQSQPPAEPASINVVILHGHSASRRTWDYLGKNWAKFGPVKLNVSHQRAFTLESLIAANTDIAVCSDPAGAPYQYTAKEINALKTFFSMGINKHLLGTYATFYHQEGPPNKPHIYDNRGLASLFGLDPTAHYTTLKLNSRPEYLIEDEYADSAIFRNIASPYCSLGYSGTQTLQSGTPILGAVPWVNDDTAVRGAAKDVRVLARSADNMCVMTNWVRGSYSSVYISHMPEYESLGRSKVDMQLLYNAFIFLRSQDVNTSLVELCTDFIAKNLENRALFDRGISIDQLPAELQRGLQSAARMRGKKLEDKSAH